MNSYRLSFAIFGCILFFSFISFGMNAEFRAFRCYDDPKKRAFYEAQHKNQTLEFVKCQIEQLTSAMKLVSAANSLVDLKKLEQEGHIMLISIWQTLLKLDELIDESDPDTSLPNSIHALQSAEAIRADLPIIAQELNLSVESIDWLVLVGLLHDMGKIDAILRKAPQWAVVGDTFPVGCKFSKKNIFYNAFNQNPDYSNPAYNSTLGIYYNNIGINNLLMAYGHDEYAFKVLSTQSNLPKEALAIIRFHSFYPLHSRNAYRYFLDTDDGNILNWIQIFNKYDLYSKRDSIPDRDALGDYYKKLINKYFEPAYGEEEKLVPWPVLKNIS